MAKDLASPDTQVRLKAVDRWAQQAPTGSVDPLIQALDDEDEQVQARALELLVQDWAREQAAQER
jgi:HEAT repeat protein